MLWRVYTCWIPARRSSQIWSSPICFRPWGVWVRLDVILSALTLLLTFDWFSCLSLKSYSSIGSSGERGQGGAVLREQQQTGKKPVRNKRYTIRVDTFEQTSFLRVVCVNKWQKTNRNLLSDADSADIFHKDNSTSFSWDKHSWYGIYCSLYPGVSSCIHGNNSRNRKYSARSSEPQPVL